MIIIKLSHYYLISHFKPIRIDHSIITKMYRLFGMGKKEQPTTPPPPPPPTEPVQPPPPPPDLSEQRQRLQAKVRELSETITLVDNELKQIYDKSKTAKGSSKQMYRERCIQLMKKRKMYEQQLRNFTSQQFTLDQVAFTKENIQNTIEMGAAMKLASEQQKKAFEGLDLDKLEDLRDDMEDMKYEADYMNELLNRDYDIDVNEADLDDDFADLEAQYYRDMKHKSTINNQQNKQTFNNLH